MCDIIPKIIFTSLGGFISGGVGILLFLYQRTRSAKDDFSSFILDTRDAIPKILFLDFYTSTKPDVRAAVFKLLPRLGRKSRIRLRQLWNEYDKIHQGRLDDILECVPELGQDATPSELLKSYMDRFYEVAK